MPFAEIDTRRIRIKQIADELQRWPSRKLVETLCCEAECGCRLHPDCALGFFAVRDAGLALLVEGGRAELHALPNAIEMLDDAIAVRKQTFASAGIAPFPTRQFGGMAG
jgi:hypothetical protein